MQGKQIVFECRGRAVLEDFDVPQPDPGQIVIENDYTVIGAHTFTRPQCESAPGRWTERDDYKTFLKLVGAKKIQTRPIISGIFSPEQGPDVFTRLAGAENVPLGIVFDWRTVR